MSGDAQPLAVRHLHPGIGETLPFIERLTRSTRSLADEGAGSNGHIAEHRDLQVGVLGAAPMVRFCIDGLG